FRGLDRGSLGERGAIGRQHVPHQVGMVDHVEIQPRNPESDHITQIRGPLEKPDGIATEERTVSSRDIASRGASAIAGLYRGLGPPELHPTIVKGGPPSSLRPSTPVAGPSARAMEPRALLSCERNPSVPFVSIVAAFWKRFSTIDPSASRTAATSESAAC